MKKYLIIIQDNNNMQVLYSTDNYCDAIDKQALFKRLMIYQNTNINIFVNSLYIARSRRVY